MSKYTTEIRFLCESEAGVVKSEGFNSIQNILNTSAPKIFNFDFPIFDEDYRLPLEVKILRHYYTREICEETVGLWKLRLSDRLNMIMPYYNQLYASEKLLLEKDILTDIDITTDHTKTGNTEGKDSLESTITRKDESTTDYTSSIEGETSNAGESDETFSGSVMHDNNEDNTYSNSHDDAYSDTPQGGVNGVSTMTYLTNYREIRESNSHTINQQGEETTTNTNHIENSQNGTSKNSQTDNTTYVNDTTNEETRSSTNTVDTTESYLQHITGKNGGTSYSKLLNEYRETFLNIDRQIIEELSDLFFGLW